MKYSNSIEYNISTKLDSSGLTKLQTQIREVELSLQKMSNAGKFEPTIEKAKHELEGLNKALTNAFNPSLGILDLSKFRAELAAGKVDLEGVASGLRLAGTQGQTTFNSLIGQLGRFDSGVLHTSSALDKMYVTFQNTFRWGVISSFFSSFMNAIHQSVEYVKDLDDSLTQIMLVTDYNRDSMNEYAKAANEAAKAVGQTTVGMTNASLIFAQQGYDLNQSQQLATLSAKLANASQQDTAATSDQITAYMNAYGLQDDMEALVQAMDNWARIANISAADVEEIALASQRAASMANAVGVSGEALAAQIATIESVTREAPEQIGNGLKTLYARFSDLKLGKDDEDGIGLGKVTSTLQAIGVQVLDAFGNVRDMDAIMEDLMVVWEDLDDTSKTAAAQALAGKHQVNRFMALMENSDMYREYLGETGAAASGTLEQMNAEYLDSLQGRITKLQSTLEGLFNDVFTTDMVYPAIDALTKLAEAVDTLFKSVGGGPAIILGLASAFTQLFSKNLANTYTDMTMNRDLARIQAENYKNAPAALAQLGLANPNKENENTQALLNFAQRGAELAPNMSAEGIKQYNSLLDETVRLTNAAEEANQEFKNTVTSLNAVLGTSKLKETDAIFTDENGLNTSLLSEILKGLKDQDLEGNQSRLTAAAQAAEEYIKALSDLKQKIEEYKKLEDPTEAQTEELRQSINRVQDAALAVGEAGGVSKEHLDEMVVSIANIDTQTENWENEAKDALAEIEKLAGGAEELKNILNELAQSKVISPEKARALGEQLDKTYSNKGAAQGAVDNIGNLNQGFISAQELATLRKETLDFVGALGQLAFAITSIKNLGRIWEDEDLSLTEKLVQSFSNLAIVIPSIITVFGKLKNVSSAIELLTIKQEALALAAVKARAAESGLPIINGAIAVTADAAAGAVGLLNKALLFFSSGPGLLVLAVLAAVTIAISTQTEEIKKAREEAIKAFNETQDALQQMQNIQNQVDTFETSYDNYDGSNGQKLIDDANDIALAMKEAGYEAEAEAIHLAAVRAETLGTAEAYEELAQTIDESSRSMEKQANLNILDASSKVLDEYNISLETIIAKEQELKQAQEDLNNLDPWDPDYETKRIELEAYIKRLREELETSQELVNAAHAYMDAAGEITGANLALTTGHEMRALGTRSEDARAASMDYYSLQQQFSQNVAGFDQLDELEQIDFMLQHVQDDAQKAALEVEQLLRANENLTANDRQYLTAQMEQAGLSAEQSLQFVATLDENASRQEINTRLNEITQSGEPFEIALRATMDPQQVREMVEAQLAEYQPTDKDVNSEDFQTMANMFMANEKNMGKEGTPFENYSADLLENADALEEVIESMLRYDDAIESLNSNLEDWREALNDTNEFSLEHIHAVQELQETYADFLDLSEDFDVSEEFAANAENLDLMEKAANGVEGAYEDLARAAAQDILIHADVQDIDAAQEALGGLFDYLNGDAFAALNVGDAIDLSSIESQINALAEATGWTADQMSAYLASVGINIPPDMFAPIAESAEIAADQAISAMDPVAETAMSALDYSVDTEVESKTDTQPDEIVYTNLTPHPTAAVPITSTFTVGNATYSNTGLSTTGGWSTATSTAEVRGVEYTADPVTTTEIKEMTGYGLTSKPKKGGKGGVKLKEGATGSKGSTGGSKRSGGSSRPSSSGGRGGGCFVAGTLVSLQNQFKNIEDIQIGDIVLSYNEEIHQNEYSIVLQTMIHDVTEEIYDLYIEDEILTVTGIHRFYVRRKHDIEWIPASDLHIGDYVLFADGNWHPIFKIKVKIHSLLVYNFEVSHNHNYYVGRNQILAHNKGGGSGGGSAKTIQPKEKKEHKKDYYEKVNSQLDKLKEQLSGIEKQEDRLIGSKARANQQKQIKLIEREIELEKERLGILQSAKENELADVKALMEAKEGAAEEILEAQKIAVTDLPSPDYDAEGIITNYEEISRAIDERHNDLIEKYNIAAAAGNEELTKTIDEAIKKFDEYSAAILENAKRQNDIQKEIESTKNTIQELSDSIEDINIEIYKVSLEAIENLKDLNEVHAEFAGFLSGFKSDSPLRALIEDLDELNNSYAVSKDKVQEFYSTLITEKEKAKESADNDEKAVIDKEIEYFQKKINEAATGTETELWANGEVGYYLEALRELRKWMNGEEDENSPNIFGNNAKALYETYLDVYKKTKESALDYEKMVEDTVGDIIDIYDEVADKQEEFLEKYEHLAKQIERYADLYALAYGEDSYDILSQIGQQQANVLKSQLNQQWEMLRWWDAQIQQAEQEGNQDLLNSLQEQRQKVIDSIGDLAQDSAKAFVDAFEKAVDASTQNILEATFKDKNFDRLDRNWEWDSEYAKKYKDEIEKAYELDSLRNNYMELLNDAQGASLNTQNKIRKQMQEQLELLKDQTTVSQYDIDLANAKLLVLQKQIALEDAQRNKNQMQLRRDSQGNYRYVYRANQDDIAKARKELLDAEYEAYELTKNHAYQTFEDIKNAYDKYLSQRADLLKNFKGTEEELAQQIKEITDAFLRSITGSAEDANDMMADAVDVLRWMVDNTSEETATAAQNMLNNILDEAGEIKDKTGVIWLDIFDFIKGALGEDAVKVINKANEDSIASWADLRDELIGNDGILTAINKEITDKDNGYASAVDAATAAIENLNIQTQSLLTDGLKPYNDAIDKNIGQISDWESTLADARATLIELEEDYKRISQIMGEDVAAKNTINIPETSPSTTTPSNNTATTTTTTTKPAINTNNNKVSEAKAVAAYNWINGGKQGSNSFTNKELAAGQDLINLVYPTSLGGAGWSWDRALKYVLAKSYDTGGYTGEWGKDGKLAVLHQKELVLNAEDTRNILSAVDIVRQMTSTLGNALTNYSIGGAKNSLMNSGFGTVDQRVEIKAEFPNVRDAFEIETALTNLADTAYQYAHRKI